MSIDKYTFGDHEMNEFLQSSATENRVPEKRHSARRKFAQEVMVRADNDHRLCRIQDISYGGLLLRYGWGKLTRDVEVEIIIDLPVNQIPTPYHLFGEVSRVSATGTAIKFTVINSEAQKALKRILGVRHQHSL